MTAMVRFWPIRVESGPWRSYLHGMRLILIVFVVAVERLIRLLFPRANDRSRLSFEEPRRSGSRSDRSGSELPVVPDRPLDMSGGAAASMHFDD